MSVGGFENLQQIPGTLEDYACSEKVWEGPNLPPLDNLEIPCKQDVKTKAELLTTWLNVKGIPKMHTEIHCKDWETYWFQAFKKIFVQPLVDH